jgi:CMP-N,N'-diacetyllegionaminic acid synthase
MIDGKRVLAIIPARGGSKGIPGKNIFQIRGRALIEWTFDAARNSRYIDRQVLSSDDSAIIEAARTAGCDVPFCRDAALATDEATSADVVVDVLQRVPGYDLFVLLQPTSPLRVADDIDGALELLISSGAPACVTLRAAEDHPYWTFRLEPNHQLAAFAETPGGVPQRRQDLPSAWCLNGAVYVARTESFLGTRSFLSKETVGYPMPASRSLDIDTMADLESFKTILKEEHHA